MIKQTHLTSWYLYNICIDYKTLIHIYLVPLAVKLFTGLIHHLKFHPEHMSRALSHSVMCVIQLRLCTGHTSVLKWKGGEGEWAPSELGPFERTNINH